MDWMAHVLVGVLKWSPVRSPHDGSLCGSSKDSALSGTFGICCGWQRICQCQCRFMCALSLLWGLHCPDVVIQVRLMAKEHLGRYKNTLDCLRQVCKGRRSYSCGAVWAACGNSTCDMCYHYAQHLPAYVSCFGSVMSACTGLDK